MQWASILLAGVFVVSIVLPSGADDAKKAQKQANKITAMASDLVGRRIVNMTMADALKVTRVNLVLERRRLNLNYGCLYVFHALQTEGVKADYLVSQLRLGKSIFQIGGELRANWKEIGARAKRLNQQVEGNLYQHFVNSQADVARDDAEHYQVAADGVIADKDVSDGDIFEAEYVFGFWQKQAVAALNRDGRLDTSAEQAARRDNARAGGPVRGSSGKVAPAAGGLPTD